MKKIGILTYHAAPNYGAVLQALAQLEFHKSQGNDCKIINYTPPVFNIPYRLWIKNLLRLRFVETIRSMRFYWKMYLFRKSFFRYDGEAFSNAEDVAKRKLDYNVVTVGSDQIWNPNWVFHGTYSWIYFLNFVPDRIRKASIAASAGTAAFPELQIKPIINDLARFSRIGVREKDTLHFFKGLGLEVVHDYDPVFLLDRKEWLSIGSKKSILGLKSTFVFLFFLHNEGPNDINEIISGFPENTTFITTSNASSWVKDSRIHIFSLSPIEWIQAINQAEFVFTNSFHAVAFCLIFNKEFIAVKRSGNLAPMNNRITSVLNEVGVEAYFLSNDEISKWRTYYHQIDWSKVNPIVNKRSNILREGLESI